MALASSVAGSRSPVLLSLSCAVPLMVRNGLFVGGLHKGSSAVGMLINLYQRRNESISIRWFSGSTKNTSSRRPASNRNDLGARRDEYHRGDRERSERDDFYWKLSRLNEAEQYNDVLNLLDEAIQSRITDKRVCAQFVRSFHQSQDINVAKKLLDYLLDVDFVPHFQFFLNCMKICRYYGGSGKWAIHILKGAMTCYSHIAQENYLIVLGAQSCRNVEEAVLMLRFLLKSQVILQPPYSVLLSKLVQWGKPDEASRFYHRLADVIDIDVVMAGGIISACSKNHSYSSSIELGKKAFEDGMAKGYGNDLRLVNPALHFFRVLGDVEKVKELYDVSQQILPNDMPSANNWLQCLIQSDKIDEAVSFYRKLEYCDSVILFTMLTMCTNHKLVDVGKKVFEHATSLGFNDIKLITAGINFFAEIGDFEKAAELYESVENPDDVLLTAWLRCLIKAGKTQEAIRYYSNLPAVKRDTILTMIGFCAEYKLATIGERILHDAISHGLGKDIKVLTASIKFFVAIEDFERAEEMYRTAVSLEPDNIVTATIWIKCLSEANKTEEALAVFKSLKVFDLQLYLTVLSMCTSKKLDVGKQIYEQAVSSGMGHRIEVLRAASQYFRAIGDENTAREVEVKMNIKRLKERNI